MSLHVHHIAQFLTDRKEKFNGLLATNIFPCQKIAPHTKRLIHMHMYVHMYTHTGWQTCVVMPNIHVCTHAYNLQRVCRHKQIYAHDSVYTHYQTCTDNGRTTFLTTHIIYIHTREGNIF